MDTFPCPEWQNLLDRQPRFTDTVYMDIMHCLYDTITQCTFFVELASANLFSRFFML